VRHVGAFPALEDEMCGLEGCQTEHAKLYNACSA
jgi:hypothetical protein